ncbi:MAG: DUF1015 domain-containing protein [Balneolaceae bacterium]|nr:DUF1015 domain-containing protein [Balneolaceae bacterium]
MAILHPFKAWHPSPEQVKQIACPPYDVISTTEAREKAQGNAKSFLHIIRPEIDLPEGTPFNADAVYKKGAENLQKFLDEGILEQDQTNALYIYQLIWKGKTQTGVFGCVSVDDYDNDVILKHELTRPDKEDDRTKHIVDQQAHAEPVMLTCNDTAGIKAIADDFSTNHDPLFDFTTDDGITHRLWQVADTKKLTAAFENLDHLYIADGHHRCKSASRAAHQEREKKEHDSGKEEFNFFPAVIFPMSEMNILPYNRVIFEVPDHFEEQLKERFAVESDAEDAPDKKGDICLYINDSWHKITLPEADDPSSVEQLDVHRLQEFVLEPMLDIKDPRRDENISFVGGIRGTAELEKLVDSGKAQLAISMYPTAIEELVEVSDEGLLMPPKSTWFEPKLRSGLLVHTF